MPGECPGWYCLFLQAQKNGDASKLSTVDGLATTNTVTITATGGVAPYSYGWALQSGSALPSITGAGNVRAWQYTSTVPSGPYTAVWRCTVTDAALTAVTVDVNVSMEWIL
jgi:hypothetical protein